MTERQGSLFGECSHRKTTVVPMKSGPHHAKLLCADCFKFLSWLPKPETIEREQENQEILTAISKIRDLPEWERNFVRGLITQKHMSPRQRAKLLQLRDLLLKERGNANDGISIDGQAVP
jgi:hypothetical protein